VDKTHAGEPRGAGNESSRGLRTCCFLLKLNAIHKVLEFAAFFFCEVIAMVIVVLEECGEDVADGLSLGVTVGEHGGEGAFGHELVLQAVAVAVASDDATDFPEAEVVEELTAWDSYLAHEQLVDVVGGG
jgi:hypothetical protein